MENFPNETDYRNPNIAEIMLNLGYVNRFGSGVNTVSTLLEENGNTPAEFLLSDYTTFKVVVRNADVIENGTDVTEKAENVIENEGNVIEKSRREYILDLMRKDKRISVKQLSKQLNVTTRTIFRKIDTLKSEGKIKRIGSDKSGTWEIID